MPKVTKAQASTFQSDLSTYESTYGEFTSALDDFNTTIQTEWDEEIQPKLDALNEAIANLKVIAEEVADDLQGYFDERSDGWQNGDKGIAYSEWIDRWRNITYMDEVDMSCPQITDPPEEENIEAEEEMDY